MHKNEGGVLVLSLVTADMIAAAYFQSQMKRIRGTIGIGQDWPINDHYGGSATWVVC
jgi:hypothetical protein